jgi:hypothetical protein
MRPRAVEEHRSAISTEEENLSVEANSGAESSSGTERRGKNLENARSGSVGDGEEPSLPYNEGVHGPENSQARSTSPVGCHVVQRYTRCGRVPHRSHKDPVRHINCARGSQTI